jgi:hypothetical protein
VPASLAASQRDHVLADGAAEWFRIHAIAPYGHPVTHRRGSGKSALPDGRVMGGSSQPLVRRVSAASPVPIMRRVHQPEG